MNKNIVKAIAKAIILINSISLTSAYSVLPNVDFYGGDMYPIYGINDSVACLSYCESIRDCRLLTWCDNTCYIKNKKVPEVVKLDCISIDMYPDDKIANGSDSGSGSWDGSGSGSNDTISFEDNTISTEMPITSTPTPEPTPSPEITKDSKKDANVENSNGNSATSLSIYTTSLLISIVMLL